MAKAYKQKSKIWLAEKKKEPWPRILIGIPLPMYMNSVPFYAFWKIASRGWPIIELPPDRCDAARNIYARKAAKSGATHLCLLDADHIHPPDIVERLARWVIADPKKQVICGWQHRRTKPYNPCVYVKMEDGNYYWLHEKPEGEPLLEVQGVSAASILVDVEIFKTIPAPWWSYTYKHADEDLYPGTDGAFSALMREHGIRMYCDTSITSPHMNNFASVSHETYQAYCQYEQRMQENVKHVQTVDGGIVIPDIKTEVKTE